MADVRTGICQPIHERALTPTAVRATASRPAEICSPAATTTSYSRASCKGESSRVQPTSLLVSPAMAETTTATWLPLSTSRFTKPATWRILSKSATEVPPNFITILATAHRGAYASVVAIHRRHMPPAQRRSKPQDLGIARGSVDPGEVEKFSAMADEWWSPTGKFAPLHAFNPVRLAFIRQQAAAHFDRDNSPLRPFEGLTLLDIGCGGGLLSEPMARLGFAVTGVDASERNVSVAAQHARNGELDIAYRATTAESLAGEGA